MRSTMPIRSSLLAAHLAFVGCSASDPTAVELAVTADPALAIDTLSVHVDDGAAETTAMTATVTVLLPDAWAGAPRRFVVDGLRGPAIAATGGVLVTPVAGETVTAGVTLVSTECPMLCQPGAVRCAGEAVETCVLADDGCPTWAAPVACPSDAPFCSAGACSTTCADECAAGATTCDGPTAERACGDFDADDCLDWGPAAACGADELCADDACGPAYPLSVALAGSGDGVVTSAPAGIDCGDDCAERYPADTQVVLTATPLGDATFTGWSGGGCAGTDPCTVTVTSATHVVAAFAGACTATCTPEVIATGQPSATCLAADADHLYWVNATPTAGALQKSAKDGSALATLADGLSYAWSVVVDDTHVYFRNSGSLDQLMRVTPAGLDLEEIGHGSWSVTDATDIYWMTSNAISRRARSGGPTTTVASGQNQVSRIGVDATHVYWTAQDAVRRMEKATGTVTIFAGGLVSAGGLAIADGYVYWYDGDPRAIRRRATSGGAIETVIGGGEVNSPSFLSAVGGYVYWIDRPGTAQSLVRVPVAGGAPTPIAWGSSDEANMGYAIDDAWLYFTEPTAGRILRLSRCACGL